MVIVYSIVAVGYAAVIVWLCIGYIKLSRFRLHQTLAKKSAATKFSVIVPFRNEATALPNLLDSFIALNYPRDLFEILFVDDASQDLGVQIIKDTLEGTGISFRVLTNERKTQSPKKDAITMAVSTASYDWLITTDADCKVPRMWLELFHQKIMDNAPVMICAPVFYDTPHNLLGSFQKLDGLSLQLVTMGSFGWRQPLLCNGANMAYKKDAFLSVSGYKGNTSIASGDDVFLLEKLKVEFPNQVHFLKNKSATVTTTGEHSLKAVIAQRIRWASKTRKQKSHGAKVVGLTVIMMHLFFIASIIGLATGQQSNYEYSAIFLIFILQKMILDFIALGVLARFFNIKLPILHYVLSSFLYPLVSSWVVIQSFGGSYQWKGRHFKK